MKEIEIELPCGSVTTINVADLRLTKLFPNWRLAKGYVKIARRIQTEFGYVLQDIYLARAICKPPRSLLVDHVDRNPLNNTRANLRFATRNENNVNKSKAKGLTSKYRGVCWKKGLKLKPWVAYTARNGKQHYHGYFATEREAAMAYNKQAKKLWGQFAPLNDVE